MNTTKDIHLSHVKFTMDDEAYIILKSYLNKLTIAFSSNSSKNEILEDIESHIAELFSANSSINRVISVSDVNNAIDVLGTPEELAEDENEQDKPSKNTNTNKKLFRDTDDSYVGGVASGLAHYFGISPAWIRVLFILFFFLMVFGSALQAATITSTSIGGNWSASTTNEGVVVSISDLTAYSESLEGDWLIENCNDDRMVVQLCTALMFVLLCFTQFREWRRV